MAPALAALTLVAALELRPHPFDKEGVGELVSHVALVASIAAWVALAIRARSGRLVAALMALVAVVFLGEEIDWGEQLGVELIAAAWRSLDGRPNLHTSFDGRLYPAFVLPWLAYFSAAWWPERARARLGDARPSRAASLAFAAAFGALALTELLPLDPTARFEEGAELLIYVAVAVPALEGLRLNAR